MEGSEDQIDYALDFGANVTEYFETYFGLEYPLPKMGECLFMQGRFVYVYKTLDFDACINLRQVFLFAAIGI